MLNKSSCLLYSVYTPDQIKKRTENKFKFVARAYYINSHTTQIKNRKNVLAREMGPCGCVGDSEINYAHYTAAQHSGGERNPPGFPKIESCFECG